MICLCRKEEVLNHISVKLNKEATFLFQRYHRDVHVTVKCVWPEVSQRSGLEEVCDSESPDCTNAALTDSHSFTTLQNWLRQRWLWYEGYD